jgi:hypothetical protein
MGIYTNGLSSALDDPNTPSGVKQMLFKFDGDPGCLRPWAHDGKTYVSVYNHQLGKKVNVKISNSPSSMTYEQWKEFDNKLVTAVTAKLVMWQALTGKGLTYKLNSGMAHTILFSQKMGNLGPASISMDALDEDQKERPSFDNESLPLPIMHKSFSYSLRQLLMAKAGPLSVPLDETSKNQSARAIAEYLEALTAGKAPTFTFAGLSIYGSTTHPSRITKTFTAPNATGWTPQTLLAEFMDARQALYDIGETGPYLAFFAPAWDQYLDDDWSALKGDGTIRERLQKLAGFTGDAFITAPVLTGFEINIVAQKDPPFRGVTGLELQAVQWSDQGGLAENWKMLAMKVPSWRADANGNMGVVHASTS